MDSLFKLAFEDKWVEAGAKVELEHTKDLNKAREIAKDHLREDADYYKDWKHKEKILFQKRASTETDLVAVLARRLLSKNIKSPVLKNALRVGTIARRVKRKADEPKV